MCLAEALLRIPDKTTIEKLITDKLSHTDWSEHLGKSRSLFVNGSTWSLFLTGKILNLDGVIANLIRRCGEPIVRKAVTQVVKNLCQQFVMGQTINEAMQRASVEESKGYRYSYDMLGEEARTLEDAKQYYLNYLQAITEIGNNNTQAELYKRSGISIKLSALHPCFDWRKRARVMAELTPRVLNLAVAAKEYNISFSIDAEEAERLDLTLDIFTALMQDPRLQDWAGLGLVVQAYQKRAPYVLNYIIALAREKKQRIHVRLVKGAYWDTEIKIAQEKGLSGYPVFTRKAATDISYIACVKQLFAATDIIYPQFATHNAYTVATILELAQGRKDFEFQRLHGMGEQLYAAIVGEQNSDISCRIYAPVGQYHYLFGYLVRRLLENGANSSFVNRIVDAQISVAELTTDPSVEIIGTKATAHPKIPLPINLFGAERPNSKGIDLTNPLEYTELLQTIKAQAKIFQKKALASTPQEHLQRMLEVGKRASYIWGAEELEHRVICVKRMAELLEQHKNELIALIALEGHRTIVDALSEVREAIDYCWYYAARANIDFAEQVLAGPTGEVNTLQLQPRGLIVCISPWNFPLAIF